MRERASCTPTWLALMVGLTLATHVAAAQKPPPALPSQYVIHDLGTLPPSPADLGPGIDSRGRYVGWSGDLTASARFGSLEQPGTLPDLNGYRHSYALSANPKGVVVGTVDAVTDSRLRRAVCWKNGAVHDLGTLGGRNATARAINPRGEIVGGAEDSASITHAFVWRQGRMRRLGGIPTTRYSCAYGINASGQIVGAAETRRSGAQQAVIWDEGRLKELPPLPDRRQSLAHAVNDRGDIVGWTSLAAKGYSATLWTQGNAVDLGGLGGEPAEALGINNLGQIVGTASTSRNRMHAVLWQDQTAYDLNLALPPGSGWTLRTATAINDRGEIVGIGYRRGRPHAFALVPKPLASHAESEPMELRLDDTNGRPRSLSEFRGIPTPLFFFCGCDRCRRFAELWSQLQRGGVLQTGEPASGRIQTVIVFSGDAREAIDFVQATNLDPAQTVLLPDPTLSIARRYQAVICPRAFVLDRSGRPRYTNSHHDDDPQTAEPSVLVARTVSALRADPKKAMPSAGSPPNRVTP